LLTEDAATSDHSTIGNPYMFTGRRWDSATQLYYYRFRDYDPQLGHFLQCDPAGYIDTMNLYAYCGNNPVNWIDPWGLCKEDSSHTPISRGPRYYKRNRRPYASFKVANRAFLWVAKYVGQVANPLGWYGWVTDDEDFPLTPPPANVDDIIDPNDPGYIDK
jgi:RHS repeat-associated protein